MENTLYCECCKYQARDNWDYKRHCDTKRHENVASGKLLIKQKCKYVYKDGHTCGRPCWGTKCKMHNDRTKEYRKTFMKKYDKVYREKNRNKLNEYNRNYYAENKDELSKKNKKYYKKNKKKISAKNKDYYNKKWRNDLEFKCYEKIRSLRKADKNSNRDIQEDFYITVEWLLEKLKNQDNKCLYCYKELKLTNFERYDQDQFSIDRLNDKSAHHKGNCVISCLECNLKSSNVKKTN